ncbi:MAG: glycosyltransferase family 8 protein [Nostoc sp. ZfuVER08]|jgi:lipopolysaccharide biosynthesis glycosyltransferase|uniref:Glycosyltransferase family 8 protein n=1 Tax=Nostoc punctiforme FACHB-252 TaxID=1357509 RepID=A0ABR8HG70_NOSPU|nr:glycosyltransferase family 8 protein [Nostoc punctiforme]MBD2614809.1 glycosyltransferase family 8 protein [Nostoc punctiforme FACHB-252]MBL1199079.1 glycosyltransferase family 8 protein [Nostoc sp. GBBB01]MDZ8012139.1 glycosyltransferase family 8 protein [Nostoc sp. ZfuVER08]
MINANNEPIVLVSTADNNYAIALAVTIKSAIVNLKNKRRVVLYVLNGDITQANKDKILKSLDPEQVEIFWLKPDETLLSNMKLDENYNTLAIYYRLFIPQLIPQHFHKAIYLDSDIVVLGDLEELWNIDVQDTYVFAAQDIWKRYIRNAKGLRNYEETGISPDHKYFNAGVLIINLEKWRTDNIGAKAIEYLEQNKEYIRLHDQDGLNAVLAGQWKELDPTWNQMQAIHEYSSWTESPYTEEVYNRALHNPNIVHFATFPKPWQENCKHPKQDLFFEYLNLTAWNSPVLVNSHS